MSEQLDQNRSRIVVHLSTSYQHVISQIAEASCRSFNGEMCAAITSWLYRRRELQTAQNVLLATIDPKKVDTISQQPTIKLCDTSFIRTSIRIERTVETDFRDAWVSRKSAGADISLSSFVCEVLDWWIQYTYQMKACISSLATFTTSDSEQRQAPSMFLRTA